MNIEEAREQLNLIKVKNNTVSPFVDANVRGLLRRINTDIDDVLKNLEPDEVKEAPEGDDDDTRLWRGPHTKFGEITKIVETVNGVEFTFSNLTDEGRAFLLGTQEHLNDEVRSCRYEFQDVGPEIDRAYVCVIHNSQSRHHVTRNTRPPCLRLEKLMGIKDR